MKRLSFGRKNFGGQLDVDLGDEITPGCVRRDLCSSLLWLTTAQKGLQAVFYFGTLTDELHTKDNH